MKVVWIDEAIADRDAIMDHIQAEDPEAALRMDETFARAAARLADLPHIGRPGAIPGTRELVAHPSYRIVYHTVGDRTRYWPSSTRHGSGRRPAIADGYR